MKLIKEDFMDILEKGRIKPVFQPIVSLRTGKSIGYEALSRIEEPQIISSSEELFYLAGIYGKIWELEQLCRRKILEEYYNSFNNKENGCKLFLNVNPLVIHDKEFRSGFTKEYLMQYKLDSRNIVFEVTERSAVDDMKGFKDTIRHYKSQGYTIAIDDAGSCYSGLNFICDVVPHYLKLDMSLIHDIHKDTIKYAMVKSLVEFANLTNIQLIAEGIESEKELMTLLKLGVHNGQGYFLRCPNEKFKKPEPDAIETIQKFNIQINSRMQSYSTDQKRFRAVLFRFESFKAYCMYCEKYGDEKGDALMDMLKNTINQNLSEQETAVMMNEETFLVILEKENYKIKCEIIASQFENEIKNYYTKEDYERGYIEGKNKHGSKKKKYPLVNICLERIV